MLPRFADIFQQGNRWLNWLEKQPEGSVRPVVIESVTKIMACGTTLMGYTQWCCSSPDCCHTKKVCFRCKSRSCPHCGVKAGAQWIQYLLSLVPDCPWQHIVFMERFSWHVADKGFRMVRYYGFLSPSKRRLLEEVVYVITETVRKTAMQIRWRGMYQRLLKVDPLKCILCGSQMRFTGLKRGYRLAELVMMHEPLARMRWCG
ncbi:transposase zinc-binding domain-containing protein [Shigella sonnei]|nr:transposase zinc-binding domain-containing protein [Shigella sonnei]